MARLPAASTLRNLATDGWQNIAKGLGVAGRDPRMLTTYQMSIELSEQTLDDMYSGDGLARKIVDKPADAMTRRGFTIQGDQGDTVNSYFEEKGLHVAVREMVQWDRLFGGALGVIGADDGQKDLATKLNEQGVKSVEFVHVFERWRVVINPSDNYQDPNHPKFGTPQWYYVTPITGRPFRVHESRCVAMTGLPVTQRKRILNQGWGDSLVNLCFESLRQLAGVYAGAEMIVDDFIQAVFSIKGLAEAVATGNKKLVKDRMDAMDNSKHIMNGIALDAESETYTKHASSVAGLPDLMDRFMVKVCADSGMPATELFGKQAQGLGATGEGDRISYYDSLSGEQERKLGPVYERLVKLVMLAKKGPTQGKEIADWKIQFRPLYQPTEVEVADLRKKVADVDKLYIDSGVLDPLEIRASRFGGDRWSMEIELDPALEPPSAEERAAEETARAEAAAKAAAAKGAQPVKAAPGV